MKSTKKNILLSLCVAVLTLQTLACGKLLKGLRKDSSEEFDAAAAQGPTVGGAWPERGLMGSSELGDRLPAGYRAGAEGMAEDEARSQGRSWVDQQAHDANLRDRIRASGNLDDLQSGDPLAGLNPSNTPNIYMGQKRKFKNGSRASRADFVDEDGPTQAGSLWGSDGQTNYYFTKNKIRGVGDILTVKIETDLVKDTASEIVRTLNEKERENELDIAQRRIDGSSAPAGEKKDQVATAAAAPARAGAPAPAAGAAATPAKDAKAEAKPSENGEKRDATYSDIELASAIDLKDGDTMMAEILERYPNGNCKIRGVKKIRYRNTTRLLNLVGVVRNADIAEDDTVPSSKLYEYRLEVLR